MIGPGSFGTILQSRLELRNLKPRRLVISYRKAVRLWRPAIPPGQHAFICNICGVHASAELARILERDAPGSPQYNSTLRFRAMMAALEEELLGTGKPLVRCRKRKDLDGAGLTDSGVYSHLLEEKFSSSILSFTPGHILILLPRQPVSRVGSISSFAPMSWNTLPPFRWRLQTFEPYSARVDCSSSAFLTLVMTKPWNTFRTCIGLKSWETAPSAIS